MQTSTFSIIEINQAQKSAGKSSIYATQRSCGASACQHNFLGKNLNMTRLVIYEVSTLTHGNQDILPRTTGKRSGSQSQGIGARPRRPTRIQAPPSLNGVGLPCRLGCDNAGLASIHDQAG